MKRVYALAAWYDEMRWGKLKCGLWGILFGQVEVKFKALEKKAMRVSDRVRQINTDRERQRDGGDDEVCLCV